MADATTIAASPPANAEVTDGGAQDAPRRTFFDRAKGFLMQGLIMYFIASYFQRPATNTNTSTKPGGVPSFPALNYFENSSILDMYVFLSENEVFAEFNNSKYLIWEKKGLVYGDWSSGKDGDGTFSFEMSFKTSENLRKNGSIYLHTYVIKRDPTKKSSNKFTGLNVASATKQLNKFKTLTFTKTQNLLTGESTMTPEEIEAAEKLNMEIVSHWHPNITINLVTDQTNWVQATIPAPFNELIEFSPAGDYYKPVVFYNDYWNYLRDYRPINETTKTLALRMTYQPLSLFKWQMYIALSKRNSLISNYSPQETDEDQDTMKEAFLENSPYLIGLTVIVYLLHTVFELLAFKNDIQFWKNRKSLEGLSVRSVFYNVFQSVIVLLYVLDNNVNFVVVISALVGLGIDVWKINKVIDVSLDRENKIFGIPRPTFKDKGSYIESSTRQYDELAFKYLSWALFPLLGCYSIYSLIYLQHKGWYSWVLNMIYGFLLTFGFIMMTPQLFINYKLKSVAHLPWRMMTYKCLNTFIDDMFAFVIKMPTMYRLGCFRDDIIFFILLYQRWIYKTDLKRVNEFGYTGEPDSPEEIPNDPQKSIEDKKEE